MDFGKDGLAACHRQKCAKQRSNIEIILQG